MPEVSIIVPVYNVEEYVAACIKSVMRQNSKDDIECLIIDDCGSDRSMQIVNEMLDGYDGAIAFQIIKHTKNCGLSVARNTGIRNASGKYVYFLDSDDIITPDCIASLLLRGKQFPSAEIIVGDFQTFPQKDIHKFLSLKGKDFPDFSNDKQWIRSIFLTKFPVIACNRLVRKDFIENHNLFFKEGILHEDNHWMASAYHSVSSVAFVNSVTYLYRIREGSITQNPQTNQRRLENYNIIYAEMFSKPVKWDKPWAEWVYNSLKDLKYSPNFSTERQSALKCFKGLIRQIRRNSSAPTVIRWIFRYWSIRQHKGQDRIVSGLLYRYWSYSSSNRE